MPPLPSTPRKVVTVTSPTHPPSPGEDTNRSGIGRKIAVGTAGSLVTGAGIVMLVTPGPGILAIAAGLTILSSEFPRARRLLDRIRRR